MAAISNAFALLRSALVRRPRHFLVYRVEPALLVVGRVLHDAMELERHLNPDTSCE